MPAANRSPRRLAAILFADIAGYTAMMQSDEGNAMKKLRHYQTVLKQEVSKRNGEIVKNYGDGSLCLFNTVVDAVRCAKALQEAFRVEPVIPLRIGLHLGDVMYEENDIYGNSINVASRIESLGISGAVLMSKEIQLKIANQKDLSSQYLGSFEFKNIEEPMDVYALANEGMIVPKKEELKGKLKTPSPKTGKWKSRAILGIVIAIPIILGIILWQMNNAAGADITEESTNNISDTLSPDDDKEKRIAILVFENQTSTKSLDVFGKMISDWITKGLIETQEVDIINTANIQNIVAKTNVIEGANPEFAKITGVDIVVQGRYYLNENKLITIANIVDLISGEVNHSFQLAGDRDDSMSLLDELAQEVINYWAVKGKKRFEQKPPKFEAYQEYIEGAKLYSSIPDKADEHFLRAFEIDSTFYAPLFQYQTSLYRFGKDEEIRELSTFLENHKSEFTKWEKLRFEASKAFNNRDWLMAANYNAQMMEMDASDTRALLNVAYLYNQVNYPQKALSVMQDYDERLVKDVAESGWESAQVAYAYLKLGDNNAVDSIAMNYDYEKMFIPVAVLHMQALIRLDSLEKFDKTFQQYLQDGLYNPIGLKELPDHLWNNACAELWLSDRQDHLYKYAKDFENWLSNNESSSYPHLDPDVFNNRPLRREESLGFVDFYLKDFNEASMHWENEIIPESNWADLIERASRLGVAYAKVGQIEKAEQQLLYINDISITHPDREAHQQYYSARILAFLKRHGDAVTNLSAAFENGFIYFRPVVFDSDPFLKPLLGYEPFLELVRPKG